MGKKSLNQQSPLKKRQSLPNSPNIEVKNEKNIPGDVLTAQVSLPKLTPSINRKPSPKAKIPGQPLKLSPNKKTPKSIKKSATPKIDHEQSGNKEVDTSFKTLKVGKQSPKRSREELNEDSSESPNKKQKRMEKGSVKETVEEATPTVNAQLKQGKEKKEKKVSSYTLFVGNLSFSVTVEELQEHFAKVAPSLKSVRLLTHRDTGKPRGIAFIEVCGEKDYQAALSLNKSFLTGRRINVEYTCAGSKKSKSRTAKITAKNLKFQDLQRRGIMTQSPSQARLALAASKEAAADPGAAGTTPKTANANTAQAARPRKPKPATGSEAE